MKKILQPGYNSADLHEPFIWEPEDWSPEEWKVLCKVCGLPPGVTERMVLHTTKLEYFISSLDNAADTDRTYIVTEMNQGVQETIVALFDKMTQEHTWYPEMQKNIHYYNGWKTNQAHKIGGKVILPICGVFSDYSWYKETFQVREAENIISDIEKVFDYLDGNATAAVDLHGVLLRACEQGQTRNIPCKFFDVTLYKKGTMHIKFHNSELVDRFNIYCCKHKGWLPPSYGKAQYSNLQAEEKAVMDSFHGDGQEGSGEKAYNMVMARADYYLSEPLQTIPMLGAGC